MCSWPVDSWPVWSWADAAKRRAEQDAFAYSRTAERAYARQLRSVAERVQGILATSTPEQAADALDAYAEAIGPWAEQAAAKMVKMAESKNRQAFERAAARAGLDMRVLLHSPGVGEAFRERVGQNVELIRSIVTHSRDAVADIVREGFVAGTRTEELAKRIEHVGEVSASRARTIAATEVSKAGTALTRARAEDVGSEGYIWRTARDGSTRPSHRAMEGRFVKWSDPPTLDNMTGHAGEFPNCRCYPEPVLKRDDGSVIGSTLPTREEEINKGSKKLYSHWERMTGSPTIALQENEPLPGADRARGVYKKLFNYSLDSTHPKGGSKARVLQAALGITMEDTDYLQAQIEEAITRIAPTYRSTNEHGQTFNVIIPVLGKNGRLVDVTTGWIYDRNKVSGKTKALRPRMVTAFIGK